MLCVPSLWSGLATGLVVTVKCALLALHGSGLSSMINTVAFASNSVQQFLLLRFVTSLSRLVLSTVPGFHFYLVPRIILDL